MFNKTKQLNEYKKIREMDGRYFGTFFRPVGIPKENNAWKLSMLQYYFTGAFIELNDNMLVKSLYGLNYEPLLKLEIIQIIVSVSSELMQIHTSTRKRNNILKAVQNVYEKIRGTEWLH